MKHKYLLGGALLISVQCSLVARAQPPDVGQARAGVPLTAEQQQQFELKQQAERQKRQAERQKEQEEEQAAQRRSAMGMLGQFSEALNASDLVLAGQFIEGEPDQSTLRRLANGLRKSKPPGGRSFELVPLFAEAPEGKDEFEARVGVWLKHNDPLNLNDDLQLFFKAISIEKVTLRRGANREWKIVPRDATPVVDATDKGDLQAQFAQLEAQIKAAQSGSDGFLNAWVRALSQPHALLFNTVTSASMSKVRQIMLGLLQFVQDYDGKLTFTPANFAEKLQPYTKSRDVFLAPILDEDTPFTYTLNPEIAGKKLAQFNEPAQTVAIYEADKDGKLLFRFDGKAVIGFMDGHVKLSTPEEAEKLIWKP